MKLNWDKAQAILDEQAQAVPERSAPSILVVDDETPNRNLLKTLLQGEHGVLTAANGKEALDLCDSNDISVVLSDFRMPKMTGVQLCRELERRKHPAIRVILTGYAELNSIITAINEAGIYRYITKPVSKDKLRAVVSDAVREFEAKSESQLLLSTLKGLLEENSAMARELSNHGADLTIRATEENDLGKARRCKAAVMAIDVRGFTQLSASTPAGEVMSVLQSIFDPLHRIVYDAGGIIDKHTGDGLIALFGLSGGNAEGPALIAARQIVDAFPAIISKLDKDHFNGLKLSLGMAYGDLVIGMLSKQGTSELTLIGEPLTLAAKLQEFTKIALQDDAANPLGTFQNAIALCDPTLLGAGSRFEKVLLEGYSIPDFDSIRHIGMYSC